MTSIVISTRNKNEAEALTLLARKIGARVHRPSAGQYINFEPFYLTPIQRSHLVGDANFN